MRNDAAVVLQLFRAVRHNLLAWLQAALDYDVGALGAVDDDIHYMNRVVGLWSTAARCADASASAALTTRTLTARTLTTRTLTARTLTCTAGCVCACAAPRNRGITGRACVSAAGTTCRSCSAGCTVRTGTTASGALTSAALTTGTGSSRSATSGLRLGAIDHVDERAVIAGLDGSGRDHERVDAVFKHQVNVDELVWVERVVLIIEDGLQLRCAGGGVDLVVHGQQGTGCEFYSVCAVPRLGNRPARHACVETPQAGSLPGA